MSKSAYLALYGNVRIKKGWCESCRMFAFIIDGKLQCCDRPVVVEATRYKRECIPEERRKQPSKAAKKRQLELQENKCLYCGREFGSPIVHGAKIISLRIHYDHFIPFAYSQNNRDQNFVAACHVCNNMKSSMCFQTLEEAQIYLMERWKQKGYQSLVETTRN